jgi:peptidoglycan/LPS O-acetylase OafA/YrhL
MYTLTQTMPLYNGPSCSALLDGCSLAQTWSLGAEVTFYLALPVYALVVERLTRRLSIRRWVAVQAGVLVTLSTASLVVQYLLIFPALQWVGWTVCGNVLWFSLGMGLAVASVVWTGRRHRAPDWIAGHALLLWTLAIALYVLLCLWLPGSAFLSGAGQLAAVQAAFGMISLLALAPMIFTGEPARLPQRFTGSRVMAWLGLISYGIFLWHFPVLLTIGPGTGRGGRAFIGLLAVTLAIAIVFAAISYYLIERPAMTLKYRRLRGR